MVSHSFTGVELEGGNFKGVKTTYELQSDIILALNISFCCSCNISYVVLMMTYT